MPNTGDRLERRIFIKEEWTIEIDAHGGAKVTIDTLFKNESDEGELTLNEPYKFLFRGDESPDNFQCDAFATDDNTIFLNLNLPPREKRIVRTNLVYTTLARRDGPWWDISLKPQYDSLSPQMLTMRCYLPYETEEIKDRSIGGESETNSQKKVVSINFSGPPYHLKLAYRLANLETGLEERTQGTLSERDLQRVREAMPLIKTFANSLSREHSNLFNGMTFLVALHFLKDLIVFLESCEKLGLEPENCYLFWKAYLYPHKDEIITYLQNQGYNVHPVSDLESVLQTQQESMNDVLVLEDGGYIVPLLHNSFRNILENTVGAVEQTTKGIRRDKQIDDLSIPILNVAEAEIKKRVEPPFVADAAIRNIEDLLPSPLQHMEVALMGLGAIGSEVLERLKPKARITVYDPDTIRRIEARTRGSVEAIREAYNTVRNKHLVIGCSGETSIKEHEILALQNEVYLVSVSSDQVEIDIKFLQDTCSDQITCYKDSTRCVGTSYVISGRSLTVHLLADGYPVNFWHNDSMPNQVSDLILSIIFLSAIELVKNNSKYAEGFQNVNGIVKEYKVAESYENRYYP